MGEAKRKQLTQKNMLGYNQTVMKSQRALNHYGSTLGNKIFWTSRRIARAALDEISMQFIKFGQTIRRYRDTVPACEHRVSYQDKRGDPYQCVLCYDFVVVAKEAYI